VSNKKTKTKAGLTRTDLTLRLVDNSVVKLYGWTEQEEQLANASVPNAVYSFYNLKCMSNTGLSDEGGANDRGGSYDIRFLYDDGSTFHIGKIGGKFANLKKNAFIGI
jgi:hypothetical protein